MDSDNRAGLFHPPSHQRNDLFGTTAQYGSQAWPRPGLGAAVLAMVVASGALAQDPSDADALRRVENAGQLTSTAAACGARRRVVDLVVERAVREAVEQLGPSRTSEALRAIRRGEDKVAARLPVVGSAECSEALQRFSGLATGSEAR